MVQFENKVLIFFLILDNYCFLFSVTELRFYMFCPHIISKNIRECFMLSIKQKLLLIHQLSQQSLYSVMSSAY